MALSSPKEIAAEGEKIYKNKFQSDYERLNRGQFAVIEINSQTAFVAPTAEEAMKKAQKEKPDGLFHLIKIGSAAAFHVSSFSSLV